jgi:hypothetical protein
LLHARCWFGADAKHELLDDGSATAFFDTIQGHCGQAQEVVRNEISTA